MKYKVGDEIGGTYKVLRILGGEGESGRGVVYVVNDGNNIIALKTIQDQYLSDETMIHAFKREALAWVHLDRHPYIVKALYVININEQPFIALDFIAPDEDDRNTLTHFMESPISLRQTLIWGIQFCHGMEYSESRGISPHRDIKPDNIMISTEGNIKITDYGLAMFLGQEQTVTDWRDLAEQGQLGLSFLRVSKGEEIGGTVPWMPAEQFEGQTDVRSDIYSFGIVLYQMVNNGRLPFEYGTIEDYYIAHKTEIINKFKSALFPVIDRCLKKEQDDRYQTFLEVRKDLEKLYKKITKKTPPTPPKEKDLKASEHNNKGVSFSNLGFPDEAIEAFKEALRVSPGYANAHNNLGLIYKKRGQLDEAIDQFRAALRTKGNSFTIINNLAKSLEAKGLYEEAALEFRTVVRSAPYFMEGHYNLARAYDKLGNYEDAIDLYKNFIEFTSSKHARHSKRAKDAKIRIKELKKLIKKKKK